MRSLPVLSFALVLLGARAAAAAPADPSLMPDFEAKRKTAAQLKREAAPAPPPPSAKPAAEEPYNPALPPKVRVRLEERPPRRPWVILRSKLWLAGGSVDTRYSVQVPGSSIHPPTSVFLGETEERGGSGLMVVSGAEVAPLEWLSFEAEYGRARRRGRYADKYWVDAPDAATLTYAPTGAVWHYPNHEDDLVLGADAALKREWISGCAYLRLLDAKVALSETLGLRHSLDFAAGAERYRQYSGLTNLEIVSNSKKYYSNASPGPIAGFDSTYDAVWEGPHAGLREEVSAGEGFSLLASFLYSPVMAYRGLGFDNQAANSGAGRAQSPNFTDWARGSAIHFDVSVSWTWEILRLTAGYQRLSFYARNGTRRYYRGDGSTRDVSLDWAQTDLGGAFAGASLRF